VKRLTLWAVLLLMAISTCFAADAKKGAVPDKALMQQILDAWNTMDPQTRTLLLQEPGERLLRHCSAQIQRLERIRKGRPAGIRRIQLDQAHGQ